VRALVTGGCGFIGKRLVSALEETGDDVQIIDIIAGSSILGRLRFDADVIYHLAAVSNVERAEAFPHHAFGVNVLGTLNVLEQAKGAPVVFASSAAVYGDQKGPLRESSPLSPVNVYGATKAAAELFCMSFPKVAILRLFNVYGPGGRGVVDRAKAGSRTIYGSGEQTRDFVHVDDVVSAMIAARGHKGFFNVGTGVSTRIKDIVRRPVFAPARRGDVQHSLAWTKKTERILGWKSTRKLKDYLCA
jgi:UDP-glucose 4-epimerase